MMTITLTYDAIIAAMAALREAERLDALNAERYAEARRHMKAALLRAIGQQMQPAVSMFHKPQAG